MRDGGGHLPVARRQIFSSGRLRRGDNGFDGGNQRLFSRARHDENPGDNSSVGRHCPDGGTFNRRRDFDVHDVARLIRPADIFGRGEFNRRVSVLRNVARTQTLSRRHFAFVDAFNRRRAQEIFHVGFDDVRNCVDAVYGIFERVEFHLRRTIFVDGSTVQLLFRGEFGGGGRGTDSVPQAQRRHVERRLASAVLLRRGGKRRVGLDGRQFGGVDVPVEFPAVHGDWRGRPPVRNGNSVARGKRQRRHGVICDKFHPDAFRQLGHDVGHVALDELRRRSRHDNFGFDGRINRVVAVDLSRSFRLRVNKCKRCDLNSSTAQLHTIRQLSTNVGDVT